MGVRGVSAYNLKSIRGQVLRCPLIASEHEYLGRAANLVSPTSEAQETRETASLLVNSNVRATKENKPLLVQMLGG